MAKQNGSTLQHPGKMEAKAKIKGQEDEEEGGERKTEIEIGGIFGK